MEVNPIRIKTDLQSFNDFSFNEKFRLSLYRIVQEQVTNILKHAGARNAYIGLMQNRKSIRLIIKDDGVGFDTKHKKKGIGLLNIQSRVSAFHGISRFISGAKKGCLLTATFEAKEALLYA